MGSSGLGYHREPKAELDWAPCEDTAEKFLGTGILHCCLCSLSVAEGQDLKPQHKPGTAPSTAQGTGFPKPAFKAV